ncbi:MAG: flagellar protein FlaG [Methylococcales bacterium]
MNISAINNAGAPATFPSINQTIQSSTIGSAKITDSFSSSNNPPSFSSVDNAVKSLNNYANSTDSKVSFNIDNSTGKLVIKIMDTANQELIRQMPTEQALVMAQTISNNPVNPATGMILQSQA